MSDFRHLNDAFSEYERRADALGAAHADPSSARRERASRNPMLLVAASVVLVLAVAGSIVWLAAGRATTHGSGGSGAAGQPQAPMSSSAPVVQGPPVSVPRSSGQTIHGGAPTLPQSSSDNSAPPTSTGPGSGSKVPENAKQMKRALMKVLGDEATFTVNQHYGNYLIGILTASSTGHEGGFDIQAVSGTSGDKASCEDPGKGSHCTISKPAQGGSLAVERETYSGGSGALYYVNYVFPNGANYLMHLSNRADPKGAGQSFGPKPPLTLKQMTAIITSDKWGDR